MLIRTQGNIKFALLGLIDPQQIPGMYLAWQLLGHEDVWDGFAPYSSAAAASCKAYNENKLCTKGG